MSPRNAGGGQTMSKPAGQAGVIQVAPGTLQNNSQRSPARLKVIIRRLPPSLTKDEFDEVLGDEWKVGAGKVDWRDYRAGKIRSQGKSPEQSRAYLHLVSEAHLQALEAKFLSVTFHDAKGTHRHAELKHLPPVLEFAPFQRTPPSKPRLDNRQGLIDQDPEFMAFLEKETQAVPKSQSVDAAALDRIKEPVTSTPLIEALREKKAARAKAAAAKAGAKKAEDGGAAAKGKASANGAKGLAADGKTGSKSDRKAAREAAKASAKESRAGSGSKSSEAGTATSLPERPKRSTATIKNLLERDLGLASSSKRSAAAAGASAEAAIAGAQGRSRASKRDKAAGANGVAKTSNNAAADCPQLSKDVTPQTPSNGTETSARTGSPKAGTNGASTSARNTKPAKSNNSTTKAYLKHANASQGVTEELLRSALSLFGELASLEIDKRKGTAMAEFKSAAGLTAAVAKRNIPVAQGAVEVLEYKTSPGGSSKSGNSSSGSSRGSRGRGGRGSGSGKSTSQSAPAVAPAPG